MGLFLDAAVGGMVLRVLFCKLGLLDGGWGLAMIRICYCICATSIENPCCRHGNFLGWMW